MADTRRVVITGATGLIGRALCAKLHTQGYAVVVFSRNPHAARHALPDAAEYVAWDAAESGPWAQAIDGAHAVIHLAGAPLDGHRWTTSYKRTIYTSRVSGARGLVQAIARAQQRPQVLLSGSAIGYYGSRGDTVLDELAPPGEGFIADLCRDWEAAAQQAEPLGVRVVTLRTGIVLDRHHGGLAKLLLPFKLFVGGPFLPGTQWWSWIHLDDMLGLLLLALEDQRASGPLNVTSPEPQRNRAFARTLGRVLGRPAIVPVPGFALKILVGEMARMVLDSQRVVPAKAQSLGYRFRYPQLEQALSTTLKRP